ncbi:hypothetical protein CLOM621_06008 [Clostridium sp. M62/1]|nr:hypothetical protein CLOM621_06008 [Clostridium sp. M62/1]
MDAEPVKLAETASAVEASFAGREYRGRQALCAWVQGRQRTAGVKRCGSPVTTFAAKPQKHRPRREPRLTPIGGLRAAAPSGQGRSALPRES